MTAPRQDFRKKIVAIRAVSDFDGEAPVVMHSLECGHSERVIIRSKKQRKSALSAKTRWCMECEKADRLAAFTNYDGEDC